MEASVRQHTHIENITPASSSAVQCSWSRSRYRLHADPDVPGFGTQTRREVGALIGEAPFNRDSGAFRGERMIFGGRGAVRRTLYMAYVSGYSIQPDYGRFYLRLVATGKPNQVVLVARMRKPPTILNALAKDREAWHESIHMA